MNATRDIKSEVEALNNSANTLINSLDYHRAFPLLSKAKKLLRSLPDNFKLKGVTYSNLGQIHRRTGSFLKAIKYFNRSLDYKLGFSEHVDIAGTHLNLSSVKGDLQMHEEALKHAMDALNLLKTHFKPSENCVTTLVVAYHNAGVQCEALKNKAEAIKLYQFGMELALEQLGRLHPLTRELANTHKFALNFSQPVESPKVVPSTQKVTRNHLSVISERPRIRHKFRSRIGKSEKPRIRDLEIPKMKNSTFQRFLTGDRLIPMHKHRQNIRLFPDPSVQVFDKKEDKINPSLSKKPSKKNGNLNLGKKIENLEIKMNQFLSILSPLRDKEDKKNDRKAKQFQKKRAFKLVAKYLKLIAIKNKRSVLVIQRAFRHFLKRTPKFSIQRLNSIEI